MQALVIESGKTRLLERLEPRPNLSIGEALIRVRLAGVCRTDLELAKGYMGFEGVLGHEFVGEVVEHPDSDLLGRRVVGEINLACRACETCAAVSDRHCPHRSVLGIQGKDGCFAEYVTLPASNLHLVPDAVSDAAACFVEPLAAAFEIVEQLPFLKPQSGRSQASSDVRADELGSRVSLAAGVPRVAVLGDGKLGQLVARVLGLQRCDVLLVGRHRAKLARAERWGIATCAPTALPEHAFDLVVEATGSVEGMQLALRALRPRGILVLKSTYHGQLTLDAAPLVIDEVTLLGSRCGPFEPALQALASGQVDPTDLVAGHYPLAQAEEALQHAARPGTLKVLIENVG